MILGLGKTPNWYIQEWQDRRVYRRAGEGVKIVADAFYPRPVWVRTLDAQRIDEFRAMRRRGRASRALTQCLAGQGIRRDLMRQITSALENQSLQKAA